MRAEGPTLLFVSVLVLGLTVPAFAAASFTDIDSSPYKAAIENLASTGIVGGYDDGTFRPNDQLMRQQFAKMAVLAKGYEVTAADVCSFTDTPTASASNPLYPGSYVAVAAEKQIILGYPGNRFGFYDNVTRQQAITIIVRAAGSALSDAPMGYVGVLDYSDPNHGQNIRKAEYNGLLSGIAGLGSWETSANATRGETAQLLFALRGKTTQSLSFDNSKHETLTAVANQPLTVTFDPSTMGCAADIHFVSLSDAQIVKTSVAGQNVTYHSEGLPAGIYQWKCSMDDCCYGTLIVTAPGATAQSLSFDNTKHETLTAVANQPLTVTFVPSIKGCSAKIYFVTLAAPQIVKTSVAGQNVTYYSEGLPAGTYQWKCSMENCHYGTLIVQ